MSSEIQITISSLLQLLSQRQISISKIFLQKFTYFLTTQGISLGLHFEPYTYGPYSFDLAKSIRDMEFWDQVRIEGNIIRPLSSSDSELPFPQVEQKLDDFLQLVDPKNFQDLEIVGTTLYCADSLISSGQEPDINAIKKEFYSWKGSRYTDQQIEKAIHKLQPYVTSMQQAKN